MQTHQSVVKVFAAVTMIGAMSAHAADAPAPAAIPAPSKVMNSSTLNAPAAATAAANNQIWECTTNGVRTFSSNPCGTKSTVRELNPINVMQPASAYRVTHTYAPAPSAEAAPRYSYPAQDSSDETYTDNAYNGNPGYVVVPRAHRVRPNNAHNHPRPHHP